MGKGSNVSKANKSRAENAKKLAEQGKGGGGKEGIEKRKPENVQEVMQQQQAERERIKKEKEERVKAEKEAEERKQKKMAEEAAKIEADLKAKAEKKAASGGGK